MSVIIDTTKSELEAVIRYARIGANNCMIANSWEVTDLVRCRDCEHTCPGGRSRDMVHRARVALSVGSSRRFLR